MRRDRDLGTERFSRASGFGAVCAERYARLLSLTTTFIRGRGRRPRTRNLELSGFMQDKLEIPGSIANAQQRISDCPGMTARAADGIWEPGSSEDNRNEAGAVACGPPGASRDALGSRADPAMTTERERANLLDRAGVMLGPISTAPWRRPAPPSPTDCSRGSSSASPRAGRWRGTGAGGRTCRACRARRDSGCRPGSSR